MPAKSRQDLVKVALVGSHGRMGRHIAELIAEDPRFKLTREMNGPTDWAAPAAPAAPAAGGVDVVIDFSQPPGLAAAVEWCVTHQRPLVSGTTGIDEALKTALTKAGQKIPLLYSANMSPGIAVMSAMLDHFANLEDWDFHVDEIHHAQKKDAPSGTALLLDQKLGAALGRTLPTPNSIRGGSVPGVHQVWAMGPDEILMLQHTALDRRVFARGALRAAGWLFDKAQPGFYELKDLYKK